MNLVHANHRQFIRCVLMVILGLLVCGCIPVMVPDRPGAKGQVVDAATHLPVRGAHVHLAKERVAQRSDDAMSTGSSLAITSKSGAFCINDRHKLQWAIVPLCVAPKQYIIEIDHPGYVPLMVKLDGGIQWKNGIAQLDAVALQRAVGGANEDGE